MSNPLNIPIQYDYIIAGGGCAGLSLVYHLLHSDLKEKQILLIEKDAKDQNDKTWCFWEKEANPFESLVCSRWQHMHFFSQGFATRLDLAPYTYKMIRSIDFYRHLDQLMNNHKNIVRLRASVEDMKDCADGAEVSAGGNIYHAPWVFSSLRSGEEAQRASNHHYLLQHFQGWVVRTEQPAFDPASPVLMDFRIAQHGDCRFVYVLPSDAHTALVEYTIFSEKLLPPSDYDAALQDYLKRYLSIGSYAVEHQEFGVIPMTDMPYEAQAGKHIIHIGTAGGATKPSTGYTFQGIQRQTRGLVQALQTTGKPAWQQSWWQQRFRVYDSTLLHVLASRLYPADAVFMHLFKNNPTARVLRFLDEDTHFREELQVAASVPALPFIKGLSYALRR